MNNQLSLLHDKGFINGQWVSSASGNQFNVLIPYDGSLITQLPNMSVKETEQAIDMANNT